MRQLAGKINTQGLSLFERYVYARFCYRTGLDFITDAEYDELHQFFKGMMPKNKYVLTSYEDDPIPYEILQKVGFADEDIFHYANQVRMECSDELYQQYQDLISDGMAKSIQPYFTLQEVYDAFEAFAGMELCVSVKVDGTFAKAIYQPEKDGLQSFRCAATKARAEAAVPINITRNISRMVPKLVAVKGDTSIVTTGEVFCRESAIQLINNKYGISLKTPRTAGISMIRTKDYMDEDYKYVQYLVHNVNYGDTLSAGLEWAADAGFDVVPYKVFTYDSKSFDDFKEELTELINEMRDLADSLEFPSDGLVVQINDRTLYKAYATDTVYDNGNFAAKVLRWQPGVYESEITSFVPEQNADRFSIKALIKPTMVEGGITVTTLNLFNPAMVIKHDLVEGSKVLFQYKNATTPLFICNAENREFLEDFMRNMRGAGYADGDYGGYGEGDTNEFGV